MSDREQSKGGRCARGGDPQGEERAGLGAGLTRRRFLRDSAVGAAGFLGASGLVTPRIARAGGRTSKVVRTRHDEATTGLQDVNQWPVDLMVHTAVRELTGIPETPAAWKSLFPGITAAHKVGIKINLACGDVPTHPEVVNAIIDGLLMMDLNGAHLPANHIIVWDADTSFFCTQTGYTVNYGGSGVQYYGTDHPQVGYDTGLSFPIYHPAWGTSYHRPSRILSQFCDYLINAAVIKDHSDSDVTLCLKNHYGSFNNIAIYQTHQHWLYGDGHARTQPELSRILRDRLGNKQKLFVIDGTLGLYDGGPGYTPPWHTPPNWAYKSVLMSTDTVAVDRIATMKINEERVRHGLPQLDPSAITAAGGPPFDLGTDDPAEIDLVEIDLSAQSAPGAALGPRALALLPPYPNPSRGAVTLRLHCAARAEAELAIFDPAGALVCRVAGGSFAPGVHRFAWDGRDRAGRAVAAGVFFCALRANGTEMREPIVLVR